MRCEWLRDSGDFPDENWATEKELQKGMGNHQPAMFSFQREEIGLCIFHQPCSNDPLSGPIYLLTWRQNELTILQVFPFFGLHCLGPSVVPFYRSILGEGSPIKIDHRKNLVPLF